MPQAILISNVMSPCPYFIEHDRPMSAAHELMRSHRVRHLPVCERGRLVGVVTSGDLHLVETLEGVDAAEVSVQEAMTPDPYQVRPNTPLREVVRTMAQHKYGCALVTQGAEIVGIFTTVDALRVCAGLL